MMRKDDAIRNLLKQGVQERIFPGAVLLVSTKNEIVFFEAVGHRTLLPWAFPMKKDTPFDLASLTKPMAATLSVMKLIDGGALRLDQTLGELLRQPIPSDKRSITLRSLLNHCSGFPHWAPFYLELETEKPQERKTLLRNRLLKMPLAYRPGEKAVYSDLGFMVVEWIVEKVSGISLSQFFGAHFLVPLSLDNALFFDNINSKYEKSEFAATESCPWRKRIIQGEVHDENAWVLGGYSGHAGLFGTAEGVHDLVDFVKAHINGVREDYLKPETVRAFLKKQDLVPGSTWALGWDTPSPAGSSAGRYFSLNSVGHLGFTGTSLWMDYRRDVTVVFLTNRIHPTRENRGIRAFRPRLHDLIMEKLR